MRYLLSRSIPEFMHGDELPNMNLTGVDVLMDIRKEVNFRLLFLQKHHCFLTYCTYLCHLEYATI
jgi:hypothetical protein